VPQRFDRSLALSGVEVGQVLRRLAAARCRKSQLASFGARA